VFVPTLGFETVQIHSVHLMVDTFVTIHCSYQSYYLYPTTTILTSVLAYTDRWRL